MREFRVVKERRAQAERASERKKKSNSSARARARAHTHTHRHMGGSSGALLAICFHAMSGAYKSSAAAAAAAAATTATADVAAFRAGVEAMMKYGGAREGDRCVRVCLCPCVRVCVCVSACVCACVLLVGQANSDHLYLTTYKLRTNKSNCSVRCSTLWCPHVPPSTLQPKRCR